MIRTRPERASAAHHVHTGRLSGSTIVDGVASTPHSAVGLPRCLRSGTCTTCWWCERGPIAAYVRVGPGACLVTSQSVTTGSVTGGEGHTSTTSRMMENIR